MITHNGNRVEARRLRVLAVFLAALAGWNLRADIQVPSEMDPVVWTSPSTNQWGTMPAGNGDVGINAWVEPGGDLRFYVSKSDSWDEHARLLKLGLVRVSMSPNPFSEEGAFRQTLSLRDGEIEVKAGEGEGLVRLRLRVDALHPVVRIEGESARPRVIRCTLEPWRVRSRALSDEESVGAERFAAGEPVLSLPDVFIDTQTNALAWLHRNLRSVWAGTLRHQGMESWIPEGRDPLLDRTFGGWVQGDGFRRDRLRVLVTPEPVRNFRLGVHVLTAQTPSAEAWVRRMEQQVSVVEALPAAGEREAHLAWWTAFWERSWIRVSSTEPSRIQEAWMVSRAWVLQRYLLACAGRGAQPIKFNGSLFTVPPPGNFDPDYRRWGGCYWFQNTRLAYWPMLVSGDLDLMETLFRMYREALPLARARTRLHFDHGGAYFPETMHFWGAWHNGEFGWGWDRTGEPPNRSRNEYIRFHWSGGLELLAMMLDRQDFDPDPRFLRETVLPHAEAILQFYSDHYPRQPDGRLLLVPSQALETWWETENPMPEVAGLHHLISRLATLPVGEVGEARASSWNRLRESLPPVPRRVTNGVAFLLPAEAFRTLKNIENPELYAVFPFRLFGVGKPELEMGIETFHRRKHPGDAGWPQDDTQAALLGLTEEARAILVRRASRKHPESRFPGFWGPNFDWMPDQTHGGNLMMALQSMLLQYEGTRIRLLPAWPRDWDVDFRLHGPGRTRVDATVRGGRLVRLATLPAERSGVDVTPGWR